MLGAFKFAFGQYAFAFDFVLVLPRLHILGTLDTDQCWSAIREML